MSEQWQRVFTHLDPKSPLAESFRVLRSNIQFASFDKPLRTLMVTSSGPGGGKSTTVANLGVTLAQSGSRVVMVDGDMRRPTLHKFFRLSRGAGLSSVILGRAQLAEVLQETEVEDLRILASGPVPPNPSEMLASQAFTKVLADLKAEADYILVDAPPVLVVADASLIAAKVDGVLLVCKLGVVAKPMALRAKEQLANAKANLLGLVLTNVNAGNDYSYYHYYYSHYAE